MGCWRHRGRLDERLLERPGVGHSAHAELTDKKARGRSPVAGAALRGSREFAAWERAAWPHFEAAPWPPTHAPLAARFVSRFRRSNRGLRVIGWQRCLPSPAHRDSRHEDRGGSTRELASPASVRRSVMRASFPREPALRPTPSTEPLRCLAARAPVGNTPFDVCHADPPRVVTAGRAFTTKFPPTSDVLLSLAGTPNRHHPVRARRTRRSRDRARLTPTISRPPTHPTAACATAGSSGPVAFRRRLRREPARQDRSYATPVKG
jgi:hypothetical protein